MSWINRIDNPYFITTGDGKTYTPDWLNAQVQVEYNTSSFNFPNVTGTLVKRGKPQGRKFNIELYFQGDNHLDISEDFRLSSADSRAWKITHPLYDDITVHPTRLTFDNSDFNVTKITGVVIETITKIYPTGQDRPEDLVESINIELNRVAAISYTTKVLSVPPEDVTIMRSNLEFIEVSTLDVIDNNEDAFDFRNSIIQAKTSLNVNVSYASALITDIQNAINFPFQITASVKSRLNLFIAQNNRVLESLGNLLLVSNSQKVYYQTYGVGFVSSLCATAVNPEDQDYRDSNDVEFAIELIVNEYNSFLEVMDVLQSENPSEADSFSLDAASFFELERVVNIALANLFNLAFDAVQENVLVVSADTNIIELAHRVYGLGADDNNLQRFIETNDFSLDEIFVVPRDRRVIYFT